MKKLYYSLGKELICYYCATENGLKTQMAIIYNALHA